MSGLISFKECVARPPEYGRCFPLADHLRDVAEAMAGRCPDPELASVYRLAGLCHDIYKAHPEWQAYVRSEGSIAKGPAHSAAGAFLFSWLAYRELNRRKVWNRYRGFWLRMAGDIADHHGKLDCLTRSGRPPWLQKYEWNRLDLTGIAAFLKESVPDVGGVALDEAELTAWIKKAGNLIEDILLMDLASDELEHDPHRMMHSLQEWRKFTTALISADRFSIHDVPPSYWEAPLIEDAVDAMRRKLESMKDSPMRMVRSEMQRQALERYERLERPRFVKIGLPTGYGKTILSLRLAIDMIRQEGYKKVVYVAPYLSILEQTSHEMLDTFGMSPMEHHSLALLESERTPDREERGGEKAFTALMMESWAHPLVCTSFQQFCKALFPGRAQHVLRRAWLEDAIVIIDEPQIFRPEGWNLVLTGLEAISEIYRVKVIFLSATMPPMDYGLREVPVELCPKLPRTEDRYRLECSSEPVDQSTLSAMLAERPEESCAAILNTIGDAQRVYQAMLACSGVSKEDLRLLHGAMTPLHKKVWIGEVRERLKQPGRRLTVISTQIIEAGVDVSFRFLFRAAAILPSIVQAAGRVNRHAEQSMGVMMVRPFFRDGKTDTRIFIYKQSMLRHLTDELLMAKPSWNESELRELLREYFRQMFLHNPHEACLRDIGEAYEGNWPAVGSFEPFESDAFKLPVFVPWEVPEDKREWIPEHYRILTDRFQVYSPEEIYERYLDRRWMRNLSFEDRKNFMVLFHYHVVNLPGKLATRVVGKEDYLELRTPCLSGARGYRSDTGMLLDDDDIELQFI